MVLEENYQNTSYSKLNSSSENDQVENDTLFSSSSSLLSSILKTEEQFLSTVESVNTAISLGILPTRIGKGTSGSYFVRNAHNDIVGVFKPRDEEQYSKNNPNLLKFMQRIFCPCFYGRSCLVFNTGYLCEASAYQIDAMLNLKLVPITRLVCFSSPSFNYRKRIRNECLRNNEPLPAKLGSLQLFADGFVEAKEFFATGSGNTDEQLANDKLFLFEFQKMAILDYIIRNTDRGMDNWLIRRCSDATGRIKIIAIDHGLSFPYRHPSICRSYPYSWSNFCVAKKGFMEEVRELCLKKVSSIKFWDELEGELKKIFVANVHFKESTFQEQMSLIRGQLANLTEALENRQSPYDLIQKPLILIKKERTVECICPNCIDKPNIATSKQTLDEELNNETKKCCCLVKFKYRKVPVEQRAIFGCW